MNENYYRAHQPSELDMMPQLKNQKFIIFDLETTGFYAELNDQITQIGAAIVDGGTMEIVGSTYNVKSSLNDYHMERLRSESLSEKADPGYQSVHWILALNGYHPLTRFTGETSIAMLPRDDETTFPFEYKVANKLTKEEYDKVAMDITALPSERSMLTDFMMLVERSNVTMAIGHNANNFDKTFLNFRLEEVYGMQPFPYGVLDTMWLTRLLLVPALYALEDLGDPQGREIYNRLSKKKNADNLSSKLQDLRNAFKIEGGTAHDALGDITTNLAVLVAIMSFLKEKKDKLNSYPKFEEYKRQAFAKHKFRDFKY